MKPRFRQAVGACALSAAAFLITASPAAAATTVESYRPLATTKASAKFHLPGVDRASIRAASLRAGRRSRRLSAASVRASLRGGRLAVRLPRTMRRAPIRRSVVLRLTVESAPTIHAARRPSTGGGTGGTTTTTCAPAATAYSDAILATPGVVSLWRLDEKSGNVACDMRKANNGTYGGGYALAQGGALVTDSDPAVAFTGSGRISVPSSATLTGTGSFSVEGWVHPDSASASQTIARKDGQYLLRIVDSRPVFRVWKSDGSVAELTGPQVLASGTYQHLVATADGSALRIFRNGAEIATQGFTGTRGSSSNALLLGTSEGYDGFKGRIDEVAVYSVALPAATVAAHWSLGTGGQPPAPTPTPTPTPTPEPEPTPAPAPVPSGCTSAFGTFDVGNWPGGCWRPFSAQSPFNQELLGGERLHSNSSAIVSKLVSLYRGPGKMVAGDADTVYDYTHPIYYSRSTDPVFTLHCYEVSWGTCPIEGHKIRIPDAARPAGGGDAHMAVIDQASGWEYDLYKVRSKPAGGGTLELRWGGRTTIGGDGLGSNATAAHFGLTAGVIRTQEMQAGKIDHALFMVVKCTGGKVYPAGGGGAACTDPTNAPAGGMRFKLDYSAAEIDAMAVPAWKKTILRALRTYGAYVGDTGGSGFNFQFESGSTYTSFGHKDPLLEWAKTQPGVSLSSGKAVFDVASGVDWSRLRVVDPCVAQRTC